LECLTANAPVATVLGSIPAQWNLRGGRYSSVEYSKKKYKKIPPKKKELITEKNYSTKFKKTLHFERL
jgi:hypothetical protein